MKQEFPTHQESKDDEQSSKHENALRNCPQPFHSPSDRHGCGNGLFIRTTHAGSSVAHGHGGRGRGVRHIAATMVMRNAEALELSSALLFFGFQNTNQLVSWRIIPVSKYLATMVSNSPKWGCSPSKWPFMDYKWRLLTTY